MRPGKGKPWDLQVSGLTNTGAIYATRNEETSKMYGLTGGAQAVEGYMASPTWGAYGPGSFFEFIVESFAGTHDFLGGQITGFYDAEGNTSRGRSELAEKASNIWAVGAIPVAAPFALSDLISPGLLQIIFAVGK